MFYRYFLIILLLSHIKNSFAKNVNASANVFYDNQRIYRGAKTWALPSAMAGVSFTFFERLEWRGPLVDFHFFDKKSDYKFDLGLRYFNDSDPLFMIEKGEESFRNQRGDAVDFLINTRYKFGFMKLFSVGLEYYKELIEHYGHYALFKFEFPVLPYTKISLKVGVGDNKNNEFVYGPGALSGVGHTDIVLKNVIVKLPWEGIIINQFGRSIISQGKNRYTDYIRGEYKNYFFNTRWIWKFY